MNKCTILSGDCSALELGMSEVDRQTVIDHVSVVYHCAATIRFDEVSEGKRSGNCGKYVQRRQIISDAEKSCLAQHARHKVYVGLGRADEEPGCKYLTHTLEMRNIRFTGNFQITTHNSLADVLSRLHGLLPLAREALEREGLRSASRPQQDHQGHRVDGRRDRGLDDRQVRRFSAKKFVGLISRHSSSSRILGDLPNTYAFTKSLGEALVVDKMETLPVVILRPSIVIPIYQDPIPGWTDNINGPTGLLIGAGKGVIRTMYCDSGASGVSEEIE